jgi:hypothetical protein
VVFKRFRDVIAGGVSSYDVVVRSFADGSERESEYASSLASIQGGRMSWLADGRLFVGVASGRAQFFDPSSGLFSLAAAQTDATGTSGPIYGEGVSSDGVTAYSRQLRSPGEILVSDIATGQRKKSLTTPLPVSSIIAKRPDDRVLAFWGTDALRNARVLLTLNADGSGSHEVYRTARKIEPNALAWAKDGGALFFGEWNEAQSGRKPVLRLMRIKTSTASAKAEFIGVQMEAAGVENDGSPTDVVTSIDVSADGSKLVFSKAANDDIQLRLIEALRVPDSSKKRLR